MVDTLNVWEKSCRISTRGHGASHKGVHKQPADQAETAVWDKIQELAARFEQATASLGVPMELRHPYKLKQ
jgi:FMN-dependent NADH-azoreductase